MLSQINESVEEIFSELQNSPIFANLPIILDCKKWPQTNEQLRSFGDDKIETLKVDLMPLLEKSSCEIRSIMFEWDRLKVEINLFLKNEKDYLSTWIKVFSSTIKSECKNIFNIIEILIITLVTNAKLEHMFRCMVKVKTDWRNRLGNKRLEHSLRISEEGVSITDYNPNDDIAKWYNEEVSEKF